MKIKSLLVAFLATSLFTTSVLSHDMCEADYNTPTAEGTTLRSDQSGLALLEKEGLYLNLAVTDPLAFREYIDSLPPSETIEEFYAKIGIPEDRIPLMVRLRNQLILHEGYLPKFYKDSLGLVTVGVGHLIETGDPIAKDTVELLFIEDLIPHVKDAIELLGEEHYLKMNEVRRRVIIDLSFNMGRNTLSKFKNTLQAMRDERYSAAANGMKNSKWCRQVKQRCDRLVKMMRTGKEPTDVNFNIDRTPR